VVDATARMTRDDTRTGPGQSKIGRGARRVTAATIEAARSTSRWAAPVEDRLDGFVLRSETSDLYS